MSAHKRAGVVASVNTGMVVGGAKRSGLVWLHTKLWSLVILLVVVLGSAGGLLYAYHKASQRDDRSTPQAGAGSAQAAKAYTPDQRAQNYLSQQNYAAAIGVYQQQLKSAGTNSVKSQLYANLATAELDSKNYSQAYQYATQADTLAPTEQTASLAAYTAQQNGDNKNATKYYQLAINRLNRNDPSYNYALSDLQASLKEVGS